MKQNNNLGPLLVRGIGSSTIAGTLGWVAMLIAAASVFAPAKGGSYHVALGPIVLNTFTKHATGEGYSVSVSLEPGLFVYLLIWVCIGSAYALLQWSVRKKQRKAS